MTFFSYLSSTVASRTCIFIAVLTGLQPYLLPHVQVEERRVEAVLVEVEDVLPEDEVDEPRLACSC